MKFKNININEQKTKSIIEYTKTNNDNMNIIVNYSCFCSKCFTNHEKMLYIIPCCHIVHENCFNNYILKNQYKNFDSNRNNTKLKFSLDCPFCKCKIKTVLSEYKINSKKKYNQYRIDIKSVKIDNTAQINYVSLPIGIVKLTTFINKLIIATELEHIASSVEYLLKAINFKINIIDNTKKNPIIINNNKITWKNKEDIEQKLIIISNHANFLDSFILFYLFRCGFVSSDFINQTDIGRLIATKLKLLIFKRGIDTNMVEKIKEYLKEQKKIIIYPEGAFANNGTMIRFRTGAFHTGATICPIVIKYDKVIYDDDFKQMLFKILTQNEICLNIYINDFFYPPFDEEKIEHIRDHMISIGKFEKSRVSNKSYKD